MIRTEKAHLPFSTGTHAGMSGKNNEDSFAVNACQLEDDQKTPALLAVLSDGVGGHRAGEIASRIAVDVISREVIASDVSNPPQALTAAIEKASDQIYAQAQSDERKGMGATCSVALVVDNRLYTATIGDSRIYLVRNGQIHQISKDHTWIQEALDSGLLQPDQVEGHPNAHVIRRYLGAPKPPVVDLRIHLTGKETDSEAEANQGMFLSAGDQLLLCSDGLTDLVKDEEILATLQNNAMDAAIQSLIDLANQRGGHDNITIVVIAMPRDYKVVAAPAPKRSWLVGCLVVLIIAVLAGGAVLAWMYKTDRLQRLIQPFIAPPAPTLTQTVTLTLTDKPSSTSTRKLTLTPSLKPSLTPVRGTATLTLTATRGGGTASSTLNETQKVQTGTVNTTSQSSLDTQISLAETTSVTQSVQTSTTAASQSAETTTVQPAPALNTPTKRGLPTFEKPTPKPLPTWRNPFAPP